MTKDQKNEVIELLKDKFSQYNNFYVTDTEALTVAQVGKLRKACFDKKVEMKVAKNTLIKKAMESLGSDRYSGVYDSLHKVTALMFAENPKDPALIITSFRKESKGEKPVLKAAFINGDVYMGNENLKALTEIKSKNELIGEVISLLQSPVKRVLAALLHHHEKQAEGGISTEAETKPASEIKSNAEAEPKVEPQAANDAEVKSTPVKEIKDVTEAKPASEIKSNIEAKPKVEAQASNDTEVKSTPAKEIKNATEAKPASGIKTNIEAKPKVEAQASNDVEIKSTTGKEINDVTETKTGANTEAKPSDEKETKPDTE
ncbi:MAG: 50S ribosomal protein L10 [Bacteroidota bacterium]|nr:50S ribosomal protein L10 [Bacteroidota bacterium]